jgi:hypothetical protein
VKPGAQEICDGIDNDCDGSTDGADPSLLLTSCELQVGVCIGKKHAASQCVAGSWLACDASNYGSSYGTEICDSKDNDCNGLVDDNASGCTYYYYDGDADGYGVESNTMCLCAPTGLYTATVTGDCNDAVSTVHPGASEICDSWDNDCDTVVDECGPVSPDPFEPNNTMETAYYYGVADNVDGVSGWACFTVTWDLYPPDTEDWSSMTIHDGPAIIELAPRAKISMTASPNVNYDLCIYYDKGSDGSIEYAKCSTNLGNLQDEVRLPEVETGGDDSGTVYFRVIWVSGISCAKFSFCYSY